MRSADASTEPSDPALVVPGALIAYRIDGAGPPVVLIHGWTLDMSMWDDQATALASSHTVIRYDRRGFGASTGTPSVARDVEDLAALLDHLGIGRAVLLGMSQGGRVALRFALAYPGRVGGLVLQGAPLDGFDRPAPDADEIPLDRYRRLVREHGVAAMRGEWLAHPCMRLVTPDPAVRRRVAAVVEGYRGGDLLAEPQAAPAVALTGRLADIDIPVLLLIGEADAPWLHQVADLLAAALPRAGKVVLPQAGHLANFDRPELYTAALLAFLARIGEVEDDGAPSRS